MSLFDENPPPPDQEPSSPFPADTGTDALQPLSTAAEPPLAGDPFSLAATVPQPSHSSFPNSLPEDLRISWSWPHLLLFLLLLGSSNLYPHPGRLRDLLRSTSAISPDEKISSALSFRSRLSPLASMVLLYAFIFLFLYVTLAVLRGLPFWRTLGWRKLTRPIGIPPRASVALFFFRLRTFSCGIASSAQSHSRQKMCPFRNSSVKNTAMLFMAMAVLVAPLVEETVFRGYLLSVVCEVLRRLGHQCDRYRHTFRTDARCPAWLDLGSCFGAHRRWRHLYFCSRPHRLRARQLFTALRLQFHDCRHYHSRNPRFHKYSLAH